MSRAYLVDTDWLIDHLRGAGAVTRRLAALRPAGLAVSVISVAELYEGVHRSRDPEGGAVGPSVAASRGGGALRSPI